MLVLGEIIRKRMHTYQDSIIEGVPNLCQLSHAIGESLAFLGYIEKSRKLSIKANRLWMQIDRASSQKGRQYAKERLTKLLSGYIQYINKALIKTFDIQDENYDVFNRKYAADVIMVADR